MKEIEKYNYDLVKKDIANIYIIFNDVIKDKNSSILMLGWFQYFVLICIEVLKYTKTNKKLKYKKVLENCRARIKPLDIEYDLIYEKMKTLNSDKMKEYTQYVKKDFRKIFSKFVNNYGLYRINNRIIGNTFLYESLYKKIIYENGQISKNKIIEVSKELGEIVAELMAFLGLQKTCESMSNNFCIKNEDYNVFKNNNKLLKENIDTNDGLILLNSISIINFYKFIICQMNVRKELKYRLGYIVYDSTYGNIMKVVQKDKINKIKEKLEKYECLNNREYRNCMFHYNMIKNLTEEEIKDEIYFGIIQKYLHVTEDEYIRLIDEYMYEIADILEKSILR